MKYSDNVILCGDFNGHVGYDRLNYEEDIGAHSIENRNEGGQRLLDFAQVNNLKIMNTFFQHRESHKWTWYRYDQQQRNYTQSSMIDLFITNNRALFCDVKAIPLVSLDADHRLVLAKLRIKKPKERSSKAAKRYKLGLLKEQDTITKLYQCMQMKLQDGEHEECNVENMWINFKECDLTSASEVLGEKIPYRGTKRRIPWWGEELKHLVRLKMEPFRKWMESRSAEDRRSYEIARSEAQRVKGGAKEESWRKIGEDLKSDSRGTRKLLYSLGNGYRGKYSLSENSTCICTLRVAVF